MPFVFSTAESIQALPDHVLMMQIDCEVINTGLVHIKEDALPIHLSARMRTGEAFEGWESLLLSV